MVHFIPFHVNCAEWSGRAEVLAGAAADAFVLVDGRHLHLAVRAFIVHHLDGTSGAMPCAVAAADAVSQHHAVLLDPNGMTHMDVGLFLTGDGLDGTGRADLAASRAFGTTVTALKRHHRLHEVHQIGGGTQDVIWTR